MTSRLCSDCQSSIVRFKECRFPSESENVVGCAMCRSVPHGHSVPHRSVATGQAAKGRCVCGRCMRGGVLWLEGH